MKRKKTISNIIYHILVCAFGLVMIYPLVWMVMSSFKDTNTIFTTATSLIPEKFTLQNYVNGWKGFAKTLCLSPLPPPLEPYFLPLW